MTRNRMQFYARIDYIASKFDLGIALNAWDNMISQFLILLIKVPKKIALGGKNKHTRKQQNRTKRTKSKTAQLS